MKITTNMKMEEYQKLEDFLGEESPYECRWHAERGPETRYRFEISDIKIGQFQKTGKALLEVTLDIDEHGSEQLSTEKLHELVDMLYTPRKR